MIKSPGKFQVMVGNSFGKMENEHEMYIENQKITSEHSVKSNRKSTKFWQSCINTMQKSRILAKCYRQT